MFPARTPYGVNAMCVNDTGISDKKTGQWGETLPLKVYLNFHAPTNPRQIFLYNKGFEKKNFTDKFQIEQNLLLHRWF